MEDSKLSPPLNALAKVLRKIYQGLDRLTLEIKKPDVVVMSGVILLQPTVKQSVDRKLLIYSFYEVAHTFDEEEPMLVAIAAVALKFPNSSKGRSSVYLPMIGSMFIFHPP